jgi:DNA polymerase III alpha subunit
MDGKRFNVQINTPSVKTLKNNHGFACLDVDKLALGIKGIKKLGNNVVLALFNKISEVEVSLGPVEKWTWYQFLMYLGDEITSTTMNGLIIAGVLDQYGVDRQKMLFEFNILRSLTKLELKGVVECRDTCKTLEGVLSYVRDNKSRRPGKIQDLINSIYNPPYSLEDTKRWVITQERNSFGVPITYTSVDVHSHIQSDTTCKEFVDGKGGDMVIQGEIGRCKEIVIKNGKSKGKKMGFLDLEDETDRISCVAFSDTWEEYMDYIYNGNIVCIAGKRSDRNGLIVNKIYEI